MTRKILLFANSSKIGGAERNILDLAKYLDRKKYKPVIAALEPGGPLLGFAELKGISTFAPHFKNYILPTYFFQIYSYLKKNKFDVIFIYGLKLKIIVLPIAYILKIPLRISMIMGLDVWKNNFHLFIEKILEKFTSIWIANSIAAKDNAVLREKKAEERIYVINNGLELFPSEKVNELDNTPNKSTFKIITIANIQEGKGHLFLLSAIKKIIYVEKNIEFEFIGYDYTNGKIQEKINEFCLQSFVKVVGFKSNIRSYIKNFDLMILPSAAESLPNSIIECMLEGIPVIATDVGGIPELINDKVNGWIVKYNDSEQLAELILNVIKNPEKRKKVAIAAKKIAVERFDIHKITKCYENVVERYFINRKQRDTPIKIVRVQSRIVVGGPALHTLLLSEHLNNGIFRTLLVGGASKDIEKSLVEETRQKNIRCTIIPEMAREIHFYDDFISVLRLYKLIRREKPQILHSHTAKAGALGRLTALLAGVPLIYHTFHGHVFKNYFNSCKTKIFILLEKMLARISTKVIVISENQYHDIVQKYRIASPHKVQLIPLGFDWTNRFKIAQKVNLKFEFGISENKYLVGIIGRLVPIKDHLFFLEIAEKLLIKYPELFHFVIIGDGELKKEIEGLVSKKDFSDNFTFTGWINISKELYQSLHVVLLTSKNEGTPVSIIESLVAGTPVVARDVGGVYDVMKHYKLEYLIKGRNSDEFVEKIIKIVSKNEEVPQSIRYYVANKYNAFRLINDIKTMYLKDFLLRYPIRINTKSL